jgi:hypothetical protein
MRHDLDVDVDPWRQRDDEIRDLSPTTFRVATAVLVGLAALAISAAL